MPAPALVLIARGSADARVAEVAHALRESLSEIRPELAVRVAFLDKCPPSPQQVISQFDHPAVHEVVFVPLSLAHATDVDPEVAQLVANCRASYPHLSFAAARPIGPEINLLTILDARVRAALVTARVLELDGLVLSSASNGDVRGSALLARRARQWSTHHRLPCLTAVADGTGPSVLQAIQGLRAQGRRHIAIGSFFLTPDELYQAQAEQAFRGGAVAVSEPIGAARDVSDLVLARYAFAAMDLLDQERVGAAEAFDDLGDWASA